MTRRNRGTNRENQPSIEFRPRPRQCTRAFGWSDSDGVAVKASKWLLCCLRLVVVDADPPDRMREEGVGSYASCVERCSDPCRDFFCR